MSNLTTWMSAGALIISVAVPFFQYIMRMREEKDKFKKSWSAGFSDTSEDQQLGHFRVRMLYSTPEDPSLTLEMVKVVKPRDALLAMKDITANSFGRSEEVLALPWSNEIVPRYKMTKSASYSGHGYLFQDYSRYEFFVRMPSAKRSNERARLSIRITVERASPKRSRHSFKIRTDETALKATSTARQT